MGAILRVNGLVKERRRLTMDMIIYGHRGARGEAPENTLAGFRHAIDRGVKRLELDLQLSADHHIVVIHDSTTHRTMDAKGSVRAMTAQELSALKDKQSDHPWAYCTGVPTLESVIDTCPEIEHFQFEVKSKFIREDRMFCSKLLHILDSRGMGKRATVTSKDTRLLKVLRSLNPGVSRGFVATARFPEPVRLAHEMGCEYLVADRKLVNRRLVQRAHRRGMHVSVWTVNSMDEMTRLYHRDVDSVITDFPTAAFAHLEHLEKFEGLRTRQSTPAATVAPATA